MTLPSPILSTAFTDGEFVNEAKLYARVFTVINAIITWGASIPAPVAFRGHQSATQSLTHNTPAAITLDVEDVDSNNGHSTSINPSRWTSSENGYYRCQGVVLFATNGTGARRASLYKNGTQVCEVDAMAVTATPASNTGVMVEDVIQLNAGDYVELWGYQSSGGALSTFSGATANSFLNVSLDHF